MAKVSRAEWALRIGICGSFLGHGVFALMGKEAWIPFLTVVGIPAASAPQVLFAIGLFDVLIAGLALFKPYRAVLVWAAFWGFATALIRPITGSPIWDFVERSANFMAPLALLYLQGMPKKMKDLLTISSKRR